MKRNSLKRPIQLTRIIAVNWYGFSQVIDLQGNLLITGEYGTGKSALLDLIQRVLLGSKARFNRAATGDASKRDLRGYCLCDTNTSTEAAEQFARDQVVTFVGLEFTWPDGKKRQTWGQRIEYDSPTSRPSLLYFCHPDRLDVAAACDEAGNFVGEAQFRAWLKREGGDAWDREESYLDNLAVTGNLNFNLKLLLRTLPEALAFQRIPSFDKFIHERLLAETPLQVEEVRRSLEVHRDYSRKLERFEKQLDYLKKIAAHHQRQMDADADARLHKVVEREFELRRAVESRELAEQLLISLRGQAEDEQRKLGEVRIQLDATRSTLQNAQKLLDTDPDSANLAGLRARESKLNQEITTLTARRRDALSLLRERGATWQRWLHLGRQLPGRALRDKLEPRADLLVALTTSDVQSGLDALQPLADHFNKLRIAAVGVQGGLSGEVRSLTNDVNGLKRDVERLESGKTHGQFLLLEFLQQKLPKVSGGFGPEQLCRLVEVKPEEECWRPALELFLRNNRFALILDAERHREALRLLREFDRETRREPLVDPEEAGKLDARPWPNSLAEKVTASHPVARKFLDHLLGTIICVQSPEQFKGNARAITVDAMFWNRPVTTKLGRVSDFEPVVGVRGLQEMKARKQKLLTEKSSELQRARDASDKFTRWLEGGDELGLGTATLGNNAVGLERLEELQSEMASVKEQLKLVARPDLDEKIEQLRHLQTGFETLVGQETLLKNGKTQKEIRDQEEKCENVKRTETQAHLAREEALTHLGSGLPRERITEVAKLIQSEKRVWEERILHAVEQRGEAEKRIEREREQKFKERELLRAEFTEFSRLNHLDDDNREYDAELRLLEDQKVQEYRRKSEESRREWEDRLKQHVLGELKRRTDAAVSNIRQLNASIDEPIGRNRYRLSWQQRRDTDFDLLWKLLKTGLEASDPLTDAIKDPDVEHAKQLLMAAVESAPDDHARQRLDYREYFKFDMECKDIGSPEGAPWISLARHSGKLSGGENQSPFFLAMLAAFLRAYHRAEPGSLSRRDTIGLVAMDEAFSKLSGESVESCMNTASTLGLQLVLAMPDKDATAALRGADTVLFVTIDKRSEPDGRVVIENWAHPGRPGDMLDELEGQ